MNVALVAMGGTIGSRKDSDGVIRLCDSSTDQIKTIIGANEVFDSLKIHSETLNFEKLAQCRRIIEKALATEPDGIVVTHGTDTLAFTSTYLAYAFADTKIPIVLCSSDKPLTEPESNGFDILLSAKTFLAHGKPGVYVIYKNPGAPPRLHHGARLMPAHLHEHYYYSIGDSAFADTGLMHGMDFDVDGRRAICIVPYVGLDYSVYDLSGYAAVVQSAYHSGTVNAADFNSFAKANPNTPIFLTAGFSKYAGQDFADNVIECHGITQTALYIKLLIALKNNIADLPSFVKKNACGEIVAE